MLAQYKKTFVLLSPLILAYALRGAKTGTTFFPVFLLTTTLFFSQFKNWPTRPIPKSVFLPFFLLLLWCWVPLLGGAPLDLHLFYYSRICLYFLIAMIVYDQANDDFSSLFGWMIATLGVIESILIIRAYFEGTNIQNAGFLMNSIHSGTLIPLAMASIVAAIRKYSWKSFQQWLLFSAILLFLSAVILIHSRTGFLSIILMLFFVFPRLVFLLIAVLAVIFSKPIFSFLELDPSGFTITSGRLLIWKTAFDAIRSKPITGYGLGNFEAAYYLFSHPTKSAIRYIYSTMFAHDGFLQVAAEAGLPAMLLFFFGVWKAMKMNLKKFLAPDLPLLILFVFFITSLFNYSLFLPFHGIIFSAAMGMLVQKQEPFFYFSTKLRPIVLSFLVFLCLFNFSYAASELFQSRKRFDLSARICPVRSMAWYAWALENIHQKKDPLPYLYRAILWNPNDGFYWQRLALVLVNYRPNDQGEIDSAFARSKKLCPNHAPFFFQEGFYRLTKAQWKLAESLFEKSSSLEPAAPGPHYGLALALQGAGEYRLALSHIELARVLKLQQREMEKNPKGVLKEWFYSDYAAALFDVEEAQINLLEEVIKKHL